MAQAIKRLPIEASAKCNGTRSGVSITRVSSVVITADNNQMSNLRKWIDPPQWMGLSCQLPQFQEFTIVQINPLTNQMVCSPRQLPLENFRSQDVYYGFVLAINSMEVSRRMIC